MINRGITQDHRCHICSNKNILLISNYLYSQEVNDLLCNLVHSFVDEYIHLLPNVFMPVFIVQLFINELITS